MYIADIFLNRDPDPRPRLPFSDLVNIYWLVILMV